MKKRELYLKLFLSTFYISAFTFGGGFVIIPLMKQKFADELHWIEENEMLDLAAIAQSAPGAVAVNASILVGYRVAGIFGALVAIVGTVLPPLIILSVISLFYTAFRQNIVVNAVLKGMQAGVAAVICDVVLSMGTSICESKSIVSIFVMLAAFIATFIFEVNVIYIILVCGIIGALQVVIAGKKAKKEGGAQ